ncbi:hypothetical protein [Rhodococcus sp. HS-D2]|uniref:hypothetical protein n=1 Tax=Rhodococcus sp. HS-D2 TaxID=1384636 RepID=UPI0007D9478B|nr:hypothetical protein [Rhodococcus sp. HS-D2]
MTQIRNPLGPFGRELLSGDSAGLLDIGAGPLAFQLFLQFSEPLGLLAVGCVWCPVLLAVGARSFCRLLVGWGGPVGGESCGEEAVEGD